MFARIAALCRAAHVALVALWYLPAVARDIVRDDPEAEAEDDRAGSYREFESVDADTAARLARAPAPPKPPPSFDGAEGQLRLAVFAYMRDSSNGTSPGARAERVVQIVADEINAYMSKPQPIPEE